MQSLQAMPTVLSRVFVEDLSKYRRQEIDVPELAFIERTPTLVNANTGSCMNGVTNCMSLLHSLQNSM